VVTRTGGSLGEVSALLSTADGTARAGVDYQPIATVVRFADGEMGSRTVHVPLIPDGVTEPDRTVQIALSMPMGCAALGDPASATLTIVAADRPSPPPTTCTVGGTATGVAGTGLLVRDALSGFTVSPANGPFVFPHDYSDKSNYDVRLDRQPTRPRQICKVTN